MLLHHTISNPTICSPFNDKHVKMEIYFNSISKYYYTGCNIFDYIIIFFNKFIKFSLLRNPSIIFIPYSFKGIGNSIIIYLDIFYKNNNNLKAIKLKHRNIWKNIGLCQMFTLNRKNIYIIYSFFQPFMKKYNSYFKIKGSTSTLQI